MRKIAILIPFLFLGINSFAQASDNLYEKDYNIGMDIYNNFWMGIPDRVVQKGINMGYSVYGMYNYRLKESNYSLAGGAGITSIKFASNSLIRDVAADVITFDTIPSGINYDRSKITFSYFDIPIEFRYKSDKEFRFAIGVKLGFRLNNHTTYKGDRLDGSETAVTVKQKGIRNVEKMLVTSTLRIGYKWINFNFNYSLSKIFEIEKGPEIYPFSVGLTLMPF